MSNHLTEDDLLDELFKFDKRESEIIEQDGPGSWQLAPIWLEPKDGKPQRPLYWKPSAEAWEAKSIAFHEAQAKAVAEHEEQREEELARRKRAERSEAIETDFGGPEKKSSTATKESRQSIQLVVG